MISTFSADNFNPLCDQLAACDSELAGIIEQYGYPPMWTRPNTFEALVHIILEQQVSLASALAALHRLRTHQCIITPQQTLVLSDEEMRMCYVSRQKASYLRHLAAAIETGQLDLQALEALEDEAVRAKLITLKGIGNWTVDIYLMFVLRRRDIFPFGDLAAVNALKRVKGLPAHSSVDDLQLLVDRWAPHRTIATMILWHYYLSRQKKVAPPVNK